MNKWIFLLLFSLPLSVMSQGIAIVDAVTKDLLLLESSNTIVQVEDQIAVITTTQVFKNTAADAVDVKYGFPLTEGASVTQLRFKANGGWTTASFDNQEQDNSLPGSGGSGSYPDASIVAYMGNFPLYFDDLSTVGSQEEIEVELTYVQLLPYEFGEVVFNFGKDYSVIQTEPLSSEQFTFNLNSNRIIETINHSLTNTVIVDHQDNYGNISFTEAGTPEAIEIKYLLSSDDLGLYGYSSFLDIGTNCDQYGAGFFTFIVEPEPVVTDVINKRITLIIDDSGSMSGQKMTQAKDAASFIVNNLNFGDTFNIVGFDSNPNEFKTDHVDYNETNRLDALDFIDGLVANGGTDIKAAFENGLPDFYDATNNEYNLVIFLTDGLDNNDAIIPSINSMKQNIPATLSIFTFGVGNDVNTALLTEIALQNNGFPQFLEDADLQVTLQHFYQTVQNPVLLNTQMTVSPADAIVEIYPGNVPDLFIGQQLIVAGRYENPQDITITFSGEAFGDQISYDFDLALTDEYVNNFDFLSKLWAKFKIEDLTLDYYGNPDDSVKDDIIDNSICYGVSSIFTSLQSDIDLIIGGGSDGGTGGGTDGGTGGGTGTGGGVSDVDGDGIPDYLDVDDDADGTPAVGIDDPREIEDDQSARIAMLRVHPNPVQDIITVDLSGLDLHNEPFTFRLYDVSGKLIFSQTFDASFAGQVVTLNLAEVWKKYRNVKGAVFAGIYQDNYIIASKRLVKL